MPDATGSQHPEWERLTEAENELRGRWSAQELHYAGYDAYAEEDHETAARLFHEAARIAAEQGDLQHQVYDLSWEADCYRLDAQYAKALVTLGEADRIGCADAAEQFHILRYTFHIANILPLSLERQKLLLERLEPYKSSLAIGGSKSAVLYCESVLLSDRSLWAEALNKALEAFSSQSSGYPSLDDSAYYDRLVSLYRRLENYPESRKWLTKWREQGSRWFASTPRKQNRQESLLLLGEGHVEAAWDALQRCIAGERGLPNYYGTVANTLQAAVRIGCATDRLSFVREAIVAHRSLRNSESKWRRYRLRYECAYYLCALLEKAIQAQAAGGQSDRPSPGKAHRIAEGVRRALGLSRPAAQAEGATRDWGDTLLSRDVRRTARSAWRWLGWTQALAEELDGLLECDVRLKEVDELRQRLSAVCGRAGLEEFL